MSLIRRHVWISGKVQGVGFRAALAMEVAARAGVAGWTRNLSDGRVEAVFEGEAEPVLELVAWCGKGPSAARVTGLAVREEKPGSETPAPTSFSVRPDG